MLLNMLLTVSAIASIVAFYFYQKEKRSLREFIRQSRRHTYHRTLDISMQKKANKYLLVSITFFLISLFMLCLIIAK